MTPFPDSEQFLCLFVAALFKKGIAGPSVKSYLAAIRYSQIAVEPQMPNWPQLSYVVRGRKKSTAGPQSKRRLPITLAILRQFLSIWGKLPDRFNGHQLWAAACMCFFGFIRSGEVVVPGENSFDPAVHLSEGDVRVDDTSYLEVSIKASKTDVFRKGVTVFLGVTGSELCPVAAVLGYMTSPRPIQDRSPGPFFVFSNGTPLTREKFVRELRRVRLCKP